MSIQGVIVRGQPPAGAIDGRQPRVIQVTGMLTNPTSHEVVVRDFEVALGLDFGTQSVIVPGPARPFILEPGESHTWTVTKPARLLLGDQPTAVAHINVWSWLDAGLAAACPV